jgi:hypothetical protein
MWSGDSYARALDNADQALACRFGRYAGYQQIWMPPMWKERDPVPFHFFLFEDDLSPPELHAFFGECAQRGIPNPRPISRDLLELASLFHPLFYRSFTSGRGRARARVDLGRFLDGIGGCRVKFSIESQLDVASVHYYLQSQLFLAGCTLSAAIIQNRFCADTLTSKLTRLWQAAAYARRHGLAGLGAADLEAFVIDCDRRANDSAHDRLGEIKKAYGRALTALTAGISYRRVAVRADVLDGEQRERFGFRDVLRDLLGDDNLRCVIAYGSSVTSKDFADYDSIVLVRDAGEALARLAGTAPTYRGRDINLGVYDESDFVSFQLMSGDNLDHNARCIFGEGEIPVKPANDLMVRNFSFAFIRLRQLLGMAGYLAIARLHPGLHLQSNLYEYFIKIPMHVMKGVLSIAREPIAKDHINRWTAASLGYDLADQASLVETGRMQDAIANAYHATRGVVSHLNSRFGVFERVPRNQADVARMLASHEYPMETVEW